LEETLYPAGPRPSDEFDSVAPKPPGMLLAFAVFFWVLATGTTTQQYFYQGKKKAVADINTSYIQHFCMKRKKRT
jgi:hypothetical protein